MKSKIHLDYDNVMYLWVSVEIRMKLTVNQIKEIKKIEDSKPPSPYFERFMAESHFDDLLIGLKLLKKLSKLDVLSRYQDIQTPILLEWAEKISEIRPFIEK